MATFRYADAHDERTAAKLDRDTWSPIHSPVPLWGEDRDFFDSEPPDNVIVAVVDGTIAGYVKVQPNGALESRAHVVMVGGLAIDPAFQRQGLGTALIEQAISEADARGARSLKLHVLGTNSVARRLYERCGFAEEGVLRDEFFLEGAFVDDVLMARDLSAS